MCSLECIIARRRKDSTLKLRRGAGRINASGDHGHAENKAVVHSRLRWWVELRYAEKKDGVGSLLLGLVEVEFDRVSGGRFRHGTRFLRWRPDKEPRQCTIDQMKQKKSRALELLR